MVRTSLLILALGFAAPALAQDSGGSSDNMKLASEASPEEMRSFAASSLEAVKANQEEIAKLANQARTDSNTEVLSCITPKAAAASGAIQVVEMSSGSLERNLSAGDEAGSVKARFELRKIKNALDGSAQQLADAKKCQDGEGVGKTGSTVDVSGGFGDDSDTTDPDALDDFYINVNPPQISPFMP